MKRTVFLALALALLLAPSAALAEAPAPPAPLDPACLPLPRSVEITDNSFGFFAPDAICQVSWYDGEMHTILPGEISLDFVYTVEWIGPRAVFVQSICGGTEGCLAIEGAWIYIALPAAKTYSVGLPLVITR